MISYARDGHVSLDITKINFNRKLKGNQVASKVINQTSKQFVWQDIIAFQT